MTPCSKALRLLLVFALTFGWTGCGSSGGGGGDSDAQTDPIVKVVEQENASAVDFSEESIAYFDALEEYFDTLETETGGIDLTGLTVEDLVALFGQEQVDALAATLSALYDQKIEPSGEALQAAYDALVLAEEEYSDFLNPDAAGMLQPEALLTVGAVCAAGGILLTGMATIVYCVQEVLKEQQACIDGYVKKGYSENVAGLACTLQNPDAIKKCGIEVATSAYTTALSGGAAGYKKLQMIIDALSVKDAVGKIKTLFGKRGCSSSQGFADNPGNETFVRGISALNSDADYFFGVGDEGMFQVPEGDWTFMAVADGYARSMTGCVSVSGSEEIVEASVPMVPSDEAKEVVDDLDGDGYNVCQGDCDNNAASAYPGAAEVCGDGVDNDCDEAVDCSDSDCSSDPACDPCAGDDGVYVWYVENLPLKDVFVSGCQWYNSEDALCGYQGGGLDCSIVAQKVLLGSGYVTTDAAVDATCATVTNIRLCGSTWSCGWLGDIGGVRHVIDGLGGCQ